MENWRYTTIEVLYMTDVLYQNAAQSKVSVQLVHSFCFRVMMIIAMHCFVHS